MKLDLAFMGSFTVAGPDLQIRGGPDHPDPRIMGWGAAPLP